MRVLVKCMVCLVSLGCLSVWAFEPLQLAKRAGQSNIMNQGAMPSGSALPRESRSRSNRSIQNAQDSAGNSSAGQDPQSTPSGFSSSLGSSSDSYSTSDFCLDGHKLCWQCPDPSLVEDAVLDRDTGYESIIYGIDWGINYYDNSDYLDDDINFYSAVLNTTSNSFGASIYINSCNYVGDEVTAELIPIQVGGVLPGYGSIDDDYQEYITDNGDWVYAASDSSVSAYTCQPDSQDIQVCSFPYSQESSDWGDYLTCPVESTIPIEIAEDVGESYFLEDFIGSQGITWEASIIAGGGSSISYSNSEYTFSFENIEVQYSGDNLSKISCDYSVLDLSGNDTGYYLSLDSGPTDISGLEMNSDTLEDSSSSGGDGVWYTTVDVNDAYWCGYGEFHEDNSVASAADCQFPLD